MGFAKVLDGLFDVSTSINLTVDLDVLAEDGLAVCKEYTDVPALMVFLQRGHGAAIRRARTRLPGGDENPVAVIQIPRERMVGSGIASSLIHEVGHQAVYKRCGQQCKGMVILEAESTDQAIASIIPTSKYA